jgi:hypothetical protein
MSSGWSKNSKMHLCYIHWLTINQGSNAVLKAEGFVSDEDSEVEKLKPSTKAATAMKLISKCQVVFKVRHGCFVIFRLPEAVKEQKDKDEKINLIEKQLEAQSNQLKDLISALENINDQSQVNQMAQTLYSSGILNVSSSLKDGSKK